MVPVVSGAAGIQHTAAALQSVAMHSADNKGEMVHIVATDAQGNLVAGGDFFLYFFRLNQLYNKLVLVFINN